MTDNNAALALFTVLGSMERNLVGRLDTLIELTRRPAITVLHPGATDAHVSGEKPRPYRPGIDCSQAFSEAVYRDSRDSLGILLDDMKRGYEQHSEPHYAGTELHACLRQWIDRFQMRLAAHNAERYDAAEGVRAAAATLREAKDRIGYLERENAALHDAVRSMRNELDAKPKRDETLVDLGKWVNPVPRWVLEYATEIKRYMNERNEGPWVLQGIQRRMPIPPLPFAPNDEMRKKAARWDFVRKTPGFADWLHDKVGDSPWTKAGGMRTSPTESWIEHDIDYAISQENANGTP